MNIAIFSDTFFPNTDGVITSTVANAKALVRRGHTVTIIAPEFPQEYDEFVHPGVSVVRIPSIPSFLHDEYRITWFTSKKLKKILSGKKIDVIHVQTPWTIGWLGLWCANKLGTPTVGTFHTFHGDPEYLGNLPLAFMGTTLQKIIWGLEIWLYSKFDVVTCPSEITKEELVNRGCSARVEYVPNGIELENFTDERAAETRGRYVQSNEKFLLYVGRVAPEKSLDILIRSFALVLQQIPNARLVIVGDGAAKKDLEDLADTLGIKGEIVFTGYIANTSVVAQGFFFAADLFVTTSKTESGPVTVMEAHACSLPCVGVDGRNTPYLIDDGKNGRVVAPDNPTAFADAIVELLTNETILARMQLAAKEKGETYDIEHVADKWEELYTELHDNKG